MLHLQAGGFVGKKPAPSPELPECPGKRSSQTYRDQRRISTSPGHRGGWGHDGRLQGGGAGAASLTNSFSNSVCGCRVRTTRPTQPPQNVQNILGEGLEQLFSTTGSSVPQQTFDNVSTDIFGCHNCQRRCYQHLGDRGQGCCRTSLPGTEQPVQQGDPAPNVNSAKLEKAWVREIMNHPPSQGRQSFTPFAAASKSKLSSFKRCPGSDRQLFLQQTPVEAFKRARFWEFPGGPVVKTLRFHCRGRGFNPWSGNLRSPKPCGAAK